MALYPDCLGLSHVRLSLLLLPGISFPCIGDNWHVECASANHEWRGFVQAFSLIVQTLEENLLKPLNPRMTKAGRL
jgi:hypothetical protein